jgi:glutamyl-tRNA synthetase
MSIITRFAPSPSGNLHLGGARTALFNFLFAKSNNGKFFLRIEDSDRQRTTSESINNIINGLNWLGIHFNEPVYFQSKNFKKHINIAESLLSNGLAYKCFHEQSYIDKFNSTKSKFFSEWRDIPSEKHPKNKLFCIRIKSPSSGKCKISDEIQGNIEIDAQEIDDYIIVRSDGTPTFLLSSAVDDYEMSISHIIRGDDHLTNSFRQKVLFDFLNYKPTFAHISLIHNEKNEKLSKRDNAPSILDFKDEGYLPEAINNYLLRLGWSYGDKEFFTVKEAIELFNLSNIGKSPSKYDSKKIEFLNNHYLKNTEDKYLMDLIKNVKNTSSLYENYNEHSILMMINLFKDRAISTLDIIDNMMNICNESKEFNDEENFIIENLIKNKEIILNNFDNITTWSFQEIEEIVNKTIKDLDLSFKAFAQPIRLLVTGKKNGPSITKLIEILGKEKFIKIIKYL